MASDQVGSQLREKRRGRQKLPRGGRSGVIAQPLRREWSSVGCIVTLMALVFAAGFAFLALLLPPFSLGDRLFGTPFAALESRLSQGDLTLTAASASSLSVRLTCLDSTAYLTQPSDNALLADSRSALPQSLALGGSICAIEQRGTPPQNLTLTMNIPSNITPASADLYGYDAESKAWQFIPSQRADIDGKVALAAALENTLPDVVVVVQLATQAPLVSVVIAPGEALLPAVAATANVIHPGGLRPKADGTLDGALPAGIEFGRTYAVIPVIRNFAADGTVDADSIVKLLSDAALRTEHVQRLAEFAISKQYAGLAVDYRNLPATLRTDFSRFTRELRSVLSSEGRSLTIVVPYPTQDGAAFDTGAYDWRQIGLSADVVQLLLPPDPRQYMPEGTLRQVLAWGVGEISRAKLQGAISGMSVSEENNAYSPIAYRDAFAELNSLIIEPVGAVPIGKAAQVRLNLGVAKLAIEANTPVISSDKAKIWLLTGNTLRDKLGVLLANNLAGVQLPDLAAKGALGQPALDALNDYKAYRAGQKWLVPISESLPLKWQAKAGDVILAEQISAADQPFVYTPDGTYRDIQFSAVLEEFELVLASTTIQVARP